MIASKPFEIVPRVGWKRSTSIGFGFFGRLVRSFRGNPLMFVGLALALLITLASIAAPLISPYDPFEQSAVNRLHAPDAAHIFGRDTFGRDIFARVLYAGRVSLTVGLGAVVLGSTLGTTLGLLAGYSGRWIES